MKFKVRHHRFQLDAPAQILLVSDDEERALELAVGKQALHQLEV